MKYRDVTINISLQKECLDTAQRDLSRDVSLENYKSCSHWGFGFPLRWNKGMQSWLPLNTTKTPVQYLWSICGLCQGNVSKWTGSSKYLCSIGEFPVLVLFSLTLLSPSLESKSGWSLEIHTSCRQKWFLKKPSLSGQWRRKWRPYETESRGISCLYLFALFLLLPNFAPGNCSFVSVLPDGLWVPRQQAFSSLCCVPMIYNSART